MKQSPSHKATNDFFWQRQAKDHERFIRIATSLIQRKLQNNSAGLPEGRKAEVSREDFVFITDYLNEPVCTGYRLVIKS